jgi:hypothetical protein
MSSHGGYEVNNEQQPAMVTLASGVVDGRCQSFSRQGDLEESAALTGTDAAAHRNGSTVTFHYPFLEHSAMASGIPLA